MTVARLLGPNKRHIKSSSDLHLSFFIVLSDFFFKKNVVSPNPNTKIHHKGSVTKISIQK